MIDLLTAAEQTVATWLAAFIGFAAGCAFTFGLATLLWKRVTVAPQLSATIPAVTLPETLRVVVTQPAPPPLPQSPQNAAGQLWRDVFDKTMDEAGSYSAAPFAADVQYAREAANAAVRAAYGQVPSGIDTEEGT